MEDTFLCWYFGARFVLSLFFFGYACLIEAVTLKNFISLWVAAALSIWSIPLVSSAPAEIKIATGYAANIPFINTVGIFFVLLFFDIVFFICLAAIFACLRFILHIRGFGKDYWISLAYATAGYPVMFGVILLVYAGVMMSRHG